jgi:hypothetical protein
MNAFNGGIELVECGPKGARKRIAVSVEAGAWERKIRRNSLLQKKAMRRPDDVTRYPVRAGLSLNQAPEPETSQIVGHLRGGVRVTEQGGDPRSQIAVTKTSGDVSKAGGTLERCGNW